MAGKIVGITIDIAGKTSGLVSSLKDADSALSKTNSALKSVNSALKFDGENLSLLTSKSDLLSQAIEQNNQKLDVLKQTASQAMETLGQEGGATTEQIAELQAEISRTEQTLAGLETEAENTNAALSNMGEDATGDMEEIGDNADEAAESIEEMGDESEGASINLEALGKIGGAAGAAVAAAMAAAVGAVKEVGQALVNCTVDAAHYSDEILTQSQVTGLSTDKLQELGYAAELVDTDVNTITSSMIKNLKAMDSAREGSGAAAEAYAALGISVTDANGNLRDSETVYWEVIDALGNVASEEERSILAMSLLGKSANDLNPLIAAGSETMAQLAEEAHNTGYVLDGETLEAFGDFDDQLVRLNNGTTAAKNALGTILLPTLNSLASTGTGALNKFTVAVQQSDGDISKIGDAVSEILPEVFSEINKQAPQIFGLIGDVIDTLLQIFIDNLPQFIDTALSIVTSLTDTLINPENMQKIADAATTIIMSLVGYITQNLDKILNAALTVVTSLLNGISQNLPQLIPVAIDAILTFVDTLLAPEQLSMLLDCSLQLIVGLATGLIDALPKIIERLPEIILGIVDFLLSDEGVGKLVTTGFDLFIAIVKDMPKITVEILTAVGGLLGDIINKIITKGQEVFEKFKDMFPSLEDVAKWGWDMIQGIIGGINSALEDLWDCCKSVGQGIADFLGFSVPEKGPLHEWAYNNPGTDMLKLFEEGMMQEMPELEQTVNLAASTLAGAPAQYTPNYTSQLDSINNNLASMMAGSAGPTVVNVQFGTETFSTVVANANAQNAYLSGGR